MACWSLVDSQSVLTQTMTPTIRSLRCGRRRISARVSMPSCLVAEVVHNERGRHEIRGWDLGGKGSLATSARTVSTWTAAVARTRSAGR
jgi:hypothetical protein